MHRGLFSTRCRSILVLALALAAAPRVLAIDVWLTTGDKAQLLAQRQDILPQPGPGSGGTLININPATTYQTMSGFGAAITDSAAWLFQNELTAPQRDKLMRQLFSPTAGIGLNYLRVPMGASDFTASGFYTYNDNPPGGSDAPQQHFSIAHDQAYIIPRLQQALELNPTLKLMASPWSAPAWMKTNHSLLGGSLAAQWEASYAIYLAKMIKAYAAESLPFDTFSIQNEPQHSANYPSMLMTAAQQTAFIKNHLGPRLEAEDIDVKLLAFDHNWDTPQYPIDVLNDPQARQFVAGSAFHAYAGNVTAQSTVHNAHPDKDIYFTEITGGDWATNFGDNLVWNFQNIFIGGARNWSKNALLWNLALNQNDGPHQGGCNDCRGVVTINSTNGAVTFNEEFYALGQMTAVVQPGALRVQSSTSGSINTAAFLNPDGGQALVALNSSSSAATMRVSMNGEHFTYQIPGKSVASFLWKGPGADFDNGAFDNGGFHQGGGSLDAWTTFGVAGGNVSAAAQAVRSGDKSLKLLGQVSGAPNQSGVSQGITVAPGELVHAQASAFIRSADSIADTANSADLKIEFYSQHGAARSSAQFLAESALVLADGNSPNDVWMEHALTAIAPAGAVEARLVLQFVQPNNQLGAVHIDDVLFERSTPGDFNRDGSVDSADLAAWTRGFGADGLQTAAGDADADGDSDGADFLAWQRNQGAVTPISSTSTVVPEPRSLWLAGLLLSTWLTYRPR